MTAPDAVPPLPEGYRGPWYHTGPYGNYWWTARLDPTAEVRLLDDGAIVTLGRPMLPDLLAVLVHLQARAEQGGNDG